MRCAGSGESVKRPESLAAVWNAAPHSVCVMYAARLRLSSCSRAARRTVVCHVRPHACPPRQHAFAIPSDTATKQNNRITAEWSCPRTTSCWPQARLLSRSPIPTCALRACTIGDTAGTQKKRAILIPPCALCSLHRRDLTRWSACCEGPTGPP